MNNRILTIIVVLSLIPCLLFAQADPEILQRKLDSLRVSANYPGLSLAIIKNGSSPLALVSGFSKFEGGSPIKPSDKFMGGSVGKTYAAAIALKLMESGQLDLEAKVSQYLGHLDWYYYLPNAKDITVRMIMNHSSGLMRYEFKETFISALNQNPYKEWTIKEQLSYIFNDPPRFPAGTDWEYCDTNFILLGLIIEQVTGKVYNELLLIDLLKPLGLNNSFPVTSPDLPGLVQGYAGKGNPFGGNEWVIGDDGLFTFNPAFEWTGGGVYSTTSDMAKWGKMLFTGQVFEKKETLDEMLKAIPAKLGPNSKYGLGVVVKPSPFGTYFSHSGFFPGYLSDVAYFPEYDICIAVQSNSSDTQTVKISITKVLQEMLKAYLEQ